jgi:predicted ABC-type sugar transport system permease subunit
MLWKGSAPAVNIGILDGDDDGLIVASQALPKFQILLLSKLGSLKSCAFDFADGRKVAVTRPSVDSGE